MRLNLFLFVVALVALALIYFAEPTEPLIFECTHEGDPTVKWVLKDCKKRGAK